MKLMMRVQTLRQRLCQGALLWYQKQGFSHSSDSSTEGLLGIASAKCLRNTKLLGDNVNENQSALSRPESLLNTIDQKLCYEHYVCSLNKLSLSITTREGDSYVLVTVMWLTQSTQGLTHRMASLEFGPVLFLSCLLSIVCVLDSHRQEGCGQGGCSLGQRLVNYGCLTVPLNQLYQKAGNFYNICGYLCTVTIEYAKDSSPSQKSFLFGPRQDKVAFPMQWYMPVITSFGRPRQVD